MMTLNKNIVIINLVWLIAVEAIVTSVVLWKLPNGSNLSGYISFAASIASLILAVVAIFYSIISNNSLSSSLSSINELGDRVKKYADRLDGSASNFIGKVEELTPHFTAIPSSIAALSHDIQTKLQSLPTSDKEDERTAGHVLSTGTSKFFPFETTSGVLVTLYLIAMACRHKKDINLSDLLGEQVPIRNYIAGAVGILSATAYNGLKVSVSNNVLSVTDVGSLNVDAIITRYSSRNTPLWKDIKTKTTKYFTLDESSSSE